MFGIQSYGTYVPFYRLKKSTIAEAYGGRGKRGEKAVAYYDEDSLTMAVAASLDAVEDSSKIEKIIFATTSAPYREKSCATQIAACLDCGRNIQTIDMTNTLRSGADAFLNAKESEKNTMVSVSDCRLGAADGQFEGELGDGAAAFFFGKEEVIAELTDSYCTSVDMHDMWRSEEDRYVRFWDVRYANSTLYTPVVKETVTQLLVKNNLQVSDITTIVNYAHEDRHRIATAMKLGFTEEQIPNGLYNDIGNTGCATTPMLLASVLDSAKAGDIILYVCYGDGCVAMLFKVTDKINKRRRSITLSQQIAKKNNDLPYGKYLKWKDFLDCEPQRRPEQERSSLPDYFRNYKKNNAMYGSICKHCGTPQFPPQRVCVTCHHVDEMEPYCFLGKKATIRTFTLDGLSLSKDSPNYLVVVDFEGGGKMMTYLVDCKSEEVRVGLSVQLSFRKIFDANGVHTYFWKVVPVMEKEEM